MGNFTVLNSSTDEQKYSIIFLPRTNVWALEAGAEV